MAADIEDRLTPVTYEKGAVIFLRGAPSDLLFWLLKGFVVVVLGGMGSIIGMLGAGFLLGIAEGIGAAIAGTGYRDMIGFLLFIIVLVLRPRGLFGRSRV